MYIVIALPFSFLYFIHFFVIHFIFLRQIVRNYVVTGMLPPDFRDYFETLLGKNGTPLRFQSIVAKRDNYY